MGAMQDKERERAAAEVFTFMSRRGFDLDDLIEIGGEDLNSSNPKKVEKARCVEKCWSLMAKLGVKYADLEHSPSCPPAKPARKRRGEGMFSEVIENKGILTDDPHEVRPLKNNNKTDDHSVGASEKGRWKNKQRLVPGGVATAEGAQ